MEEIKLIRIANNEEDLVDIINNMHEKGFELRKLVNMSKFHFDTPAEGYYRLEFGQSAIEWVKRGDPI